MTDLSSEIADALDKAAYEGVCKYKLTAATSLQETNIGEIKVVKIRDRPELYVLKTLKLDEQNVYAVTKDLSIRKRTLRGTHNQHIVFIADKSECKEWCQCYRVSDLVIKKVCYITGELDRDRAKTVLLGNEYINEAAIGMVAKFIPLPHFVHTHDAYIKHGMGNILMDYAGQPMMRMMTEFSLDQFKSATMQTLLALHFAQEYVQMKHHDLHLDNVFIGMVHEQQHKGTKLSSAPAWKYTVADQDYFVPHMNLLVKLGDYGLASANIGSLRFERVDYPMLDSCSMYWGAWNGKLDGNRSYDIVTYLTKFFLLDEASRLSEECLHWVYSLWDALHELHNNERMPIIGSINGRPLRGHEGNVSPKEFLQHRVFDEFRVPKPCVEII
jgi:hypothetical protein